MKKKPLIIGIIVVLIIIAVAAAAGFKSFVDKMDSGVEQLKNLQINDVDLSSIPDGTYMGTYETFPIKAQVEVTVKDHKIEAIHILEHKTGKGQGAEAIPSKVIEAQSLEVDVIAGASHSSKIILKAIENALTR